jgi:hypothetical protein
LSALTLFKHPSPSALICGFSNPFLSDASLLFLLLFPRAGVDSLLNGPLHGLVCDEHGNGPVEDLATGAAEGVEDGGVKSSGKRVLTVLGEAVVDNALLGKRACVEDVVRIMLVLLAVCSGLVVVFSAYQGHPKVRGSCEDVSIASS